MGLLERLRPNPGWKDPDPKVRRAALRGLADAAVIAELARSDPDPRVRDEAAGALLALALEGQDERAGLQALDALDDPKLLLQVARSALHESVSRGALRRLIDAKALGSVARHGRQAAARLEALARLVESPAGTHAIRDELMAVALRGTHDDAALSALEHLTGSDRFTVIRGTAAAQRGAAGEVFLNEIAEHGKSRAAVRRARAILHEQKLAAEGGTVRPRTDRMAQLHLCERAEAMGSSPGCEPLAAGIAAAQDAWTDLVPGVDDDLDERFQAAIQTARERLRRNLEERQERKRRDDLLRASREEHVAPRLRLIEWLEAARAEDAPRVIEDACWEWNRLEPPDDARPADPVEGEALAEARALGARFDEARKACQCRHETWRQEQAEAGRRATEEAARAERAQHEAELRQQERDHLARLVKLCERAERLLRAQAPSLKKADPVLRDLRGALESVPPLPSRRDHDALLERLKAARAALAPRVQELRDAERWKRWANTNVQEELCARAEALLEIADPEEAAGRLPDLLERWKTASVAEPDRGQALWQRFKSAVDEVRSRQEALLAENTGKKRALCEQAEALSASADWIRTAEAIKTLQAAWKTIGSVTRGQERALWERFRKACDEFFTRRDQDRARRKDEWARNLEAKEALCSRAGALADSTDWKAAAAEIKRLQTEWKAIGAVRPNRSEAVWQSFHSACDRFFERYKRRDQIDRERNVAARAALCAELETLLAGATEGLTEKLESAWSRWQKSQPVVGEEASALGERFHRALDALIAGHPEEVRGTLFDADANLRKMEELCARVERLLPGGAAASSDALSPATRLATLWREALASNTIGG
ncbi:MAG: hypothetical protein AUH92_05915, partial [Acidobacteria bacterium 13_1_40CM_4_69_4]